MAKFMFVYKGPASGMKDLSDEQVSAVLQAWKDWMEKTGSALVDIGQPAADSYSFVDDGSTGTAVQLNGYSIVEADDMEGAKHIAKDHPFLSEGKGNYSIDIFELAPVPM